jgi:hypothetical protein
MYFKDELDGYFQRNLQIGLRSSQTEYVDAMGDIQDHRNLTYIYV